MKDIIMKRLREEERPDVESDVISDGLSGDLAGKLPENSEGVLNGLTYRQLLKRAMDQSAIDLNCSPDDFLCGENRVVYSVPHPQARRYLTLPFDCNLVSYGKNIVASVKPETEPAVRAYIDRYTVEHCFETPNLHVLDDALRDMGLRSCFMAEYFLPDPEQLAQRPCEYEIRLMEPENFAELYKPQWSNALSETRKELDVLGTGAFDRGRLVGLAACSADCEDMWQIGVDVIPEYRRHGIAAALTSRLTEEILARGKVPFYCAAWSNIGSVRNAMASGFRPAWVEMTVKPMEFVDSLNRAVE